MMSETDQIMAELSLDLDVLCLLTDRSKTPWSRGFLASARIERAVREWFGVRNAV